MAKIVIDPIRDASNSLFRVVSLLSIMATENSNNRSKPKFRNKTKSMYIFILITISIIKKI